MRAVYEVMTSSAAAMLFQLSVGADDPALALPLRGGIEIALGVHVPEEEFLYSPALTHAYELESKKAIYPRALIGPRVIEFLSTWVHQQPTNMAEGYSQHLARRLAGLVFVDHDDKPALDFFGTTFRDMLGADAQERQGLAGKAWRFAKDSLRAAKDCGDPKIIAKYEWLVGYMKPRLAHWGVDPSV